MEKVFELNQIKPFEIKIFLEGQCSAFLPMSFIEKEELLYVLYSCEDYIAIDDLKLSSPYETLDVIEKLLLCIKNAENHLIPFPRYQLSIEKIFFSKKTNQVRLLFEPRNLNKEMDLIIMNFPILFNQTLEEIKNLVIDNRTCEYIDMVINKLTNSNISKEGLINYIGELKREVHICGWK